MDQEFFPGETDREVRLKLHRERLLRAKLWHETGNKINHIKIEENSVEEHFEANWGKYNEIYRAEVDMWWMAFKERQELTVVESNDGNKTFVLDIDNLAIGKPEDTFYFYQLKPCWAVMVDLETEDNKKLRVGYHQGGLLNVFRDIRDVDIQALVDILEEEGKIQKITIFYNGSIQQDTDIEATKKATPKEIPLTIHDMRKVKGGGTQDLFVTGDTAEMYHNEGSKRVYSGKLNL